MLHEKFEELLKHLSLKQSTIEDIIAIVTPHIRSAAKASESQYRSLRAQLIALDAKRYGVDEKLFEGVINDNTYKKWILKLNAERA